MPPTSSLPVSDVRLSPDTIRRELDGLALLDANVGIGPRSIPFDGDLVHAGAILAAMDRWGIRRAVVYHHAAVENHPLVGNKLLMSEVTDLDRLLPQWVVLPESTGEFPSADQLARLLADQKIMSVRVAPSAHGYSFTPWCCGVLLGTLQDEGIPVFVDTEEVSWEDLAAVLTTFPRLRVVLTRTGYRIGRNVYSLLRRFENLYMEFTEYVIHWGIEDLCQQVGAERFVFGSGLGRDDPAVPLTVLAMADLPRNGKELLAGRNLAWLLRVEAA